MIVRHYLKKRKFRMAACVWLLPDRHEIKKDGGTVSVWPLVLDDLIREERKAAANA